MIERRAGRDERGRFFYDGAGGIYAFCGICGKWVKINKFLLGSLHICNDPAEDDLKSGTNG